MEPKRNGGARCHPEEFENARAIFGGEMKQEQTKGREWLYVFGVGRRIIGRLGQPPPMIGVSQKRPTKIYQRER